MEGMCRLVPEVPGRTNVLVLLNATNTKGAPCRNVFPMVMQVLSQ